MLNKTQTARLINLTNYVISLSKESHINSFGSNLGVFGHSQAQTSQATQDAVNTLQALIDGKLSVDHINQLQADMQTLSILKDVKAVDRVASSGNLDLDKELKFLDQVRDSLMAK